MSEPPTAPTGSEAPITALVLLGLLQALPSPALPRGFAAREDPRGAARILVSTDSRAGASALAVMRERLWALSAYFDAPPQPSGAIADEGDQPVRATVGGQAERDRHGTLAGSSGVGTDKTVRG